ncbi:GTP-binding protein [Paracoccus liaowanqingii]|uniref:GTP-binding protein n=1 Tax=Paracoccus liaowanqingii TaxID=2560053 RepID=A0A4P7HJU8_9RHOB|nr:GTP-binding protein [Paracoccus liaowanqingii]QBX33890.1 GTP-binding protein [Paracoccus liaowanqingii]
MKAEAGRRDGRIPLTLLGGFLGAGKSTWLRHQLHEGRFRKRHFLVNEAALTPVDNLLLGKAARVEVLAGGCACCDGLPALVAALRQICDEATTSGASGIDGVLLETSGLADPGAIAVALAADQVLARRLVMEKVVVIVDAVHGRDQLAGEPLARAQVEAADELILSKPLLAKYGDLARLAATIRVLNPTAVISAAEHGTPVSLTLGSALPFPLPVVAAMAEPIRPYRIEVGKDGGWIALSTWLSALLQSRGDDVVRVKGIVRAPAGLLLLQSVRRMVQPPEILPERDAWLSGPAPEEGMIVLIGRNLDGELLERSWRRFGA